MKPSNHLMIPGPTPLPDAVREALALPAVGHRSGEFKTVLKRVFPRLRWLFQTEHDVLLYTASGTGAGEAALMNTLNPGDKVLCLVNGVFSERWAQVAESLGMKVERLTVPMGQANTLDALKARLNEDYGKEIKAVTLNHSATSTGVLNPVKEMAAMIRKHGALSIVDAVTSLGAAAFKMDEWGIDMAFSGSQKGFMIPPGLSFLAVGPRAWEAHKACQNPGYYFNFTQYKKAQDQDNTPYTPATCLIQALDVALNLMEEEGLTGLAIRHETLRDLTRGGLRAMGLNLFVPDDTIAATAATSVLPPHGIAVDDIRAGLRNRFGITVANGQKDLKGKIFRVGHLGHVSERDVYMTLSALEAVLQELGHVVPPGAAMAGAQQALSKRVAQQKGEVAHV